MEQVFEEIDRIVRRDPGRRGLASNWKNTSLRQLTGELRRVRRAVIVTGFAVPEKNAGETDGPGGAANLARSLLALGSQVTVVTDRLSFRLVHAACLLYAPGASVILVPDEGAPAFCQSLLETANPTHVFSIERPGKSADGHYYNMKGAAIDDWVADTDLLCGAADAVTICIGDGGNELGMGSCAETVCRCVPQGAQICAATTADYPLVAGVSNWWGWGITALLSVICDENLLPDTAEERALLRAVCRAGAVDGVTKKREETVDNLPFSSHMAVLQRLHAAVNDFLARRASAPTPTAYTIPSIPPRSFLSAVLLPLTPFPEAAL